MNSIVELKHSAHRVSQGMKTYTVVSPLSLVAFLILGASVAMPQRTDAAGTSNIDLRVSVTKYSMSAYYSMLLQSYDDRPVVINRIVINKKIGTPCDYGGYELSVIKFPFRLDYGDSQIVGSAGCGRPIHLDVYTNRGTLPLDIEY